MTKDSTHPLDPRVQRALSELRGLIAAHYPTATFDIFHRDDPEGVRLRATVDVEDTDEVMDLLMEKLYQVQVEQELPVYVVTAQPLERVGEQLHNRRRRHNSALPHG
ncbi:MAG: hypothetical protein ACRDJE_01165 [Dehalococcoidia bacterium]